MGYQFSAASSSRRASLHTDLQVLCDAVISYVDCSVLCGHRTEEAQDKAVASGASKVVFPNSKHNVYPSNAVDLGPYIPGVATYNKKQCLYFGGIVMAVAAVLYREGKMGFRIRWGGDWDRDGDVTDNFFDDLVHFELILDESTSGALL